VNRIRGFTLIEVMVAVTLLSMLMVATISAMRTLGNTRSSIEQLTERMDEIRVVSEFLRNSLGAAMPVPRVGQTAEAFTGGKSYGTFFAGDATRLMWVAPLVAGADMGGVFVLYLTLVDDTLELQWTPYQRDVQMLDWGAVEPRALLQSVEEFQVGYLAAYGQEWLDVWEGSQSNPIAVRINIRTAGKYWPELVIRLSGADMNMQ
jgi:general secretion pathway protein J